MFRELFITIVALAETLKKAPPHIAIKSVDIKTKYQSTNLFLCRMLNFILDGCSDELFVYYANREVLNCIKISSDDELAEMVLAKELVMFFRKGDRVSIYDFVSHIGGHDLRNEIVPDSVKFIGKM